MAALTFFDKIWQQHEIVKREDGLSLLYIDRDMVHEGSFHAFKMLHKRNLGVSAPEMVFGVADHYAPTHGRRAMDAPTPEIKDIIELFDRNMRWSSANYYDLASKKQGIVHVIGPELGITVPGIILVCSDSHTSTHGALGAIAFGVGQSENAHVMATRTLWQTKPRRMRIKLDGPLSKGVYAKDVILKIINTIGAAGGTGFSIEYAGSLIGSFTMEERLTVCNMSIEAGAKFGCIAPDETTYEYVKGREFAPKGALWDKAVAYWKTLPSDADARFDSELQLDVRSLAPMVTWGTNAEQAGEVIEQVPDPSSWRDPVKRESAEKALVYMGLRPGVKLDGIPVDRVFIGSCTNARISDLREAAKVLRGSRVTVPTMIVPGSTAVKREAEALGLDRVFAAAGAEWLESGCSLCVAINGDMVAPGQRCASTSSRNFVGRQGRGARTHLMSPAMAAAAAITGHITDVRGFL